MKRIKYLMILLIFLFDMVIIKAYDFSPYLNGKTSIYSNESFTITFGVKNAPEIYGISSSLNYDEDKLQITSSKGLNGFYLSLGKSVVLDSSNSKKGTFTLFSITFKAKDNFEVGQTTTISFSNIEAGDGENLFQGGNTSITIKMLAPKSSNNNLNYLKINDESLDLTKTNHTITVENNVESVKITAEKEDDTASITGTGEKTLKLYSNVFSVVVTAENSSKKTYKITVIRKDEEGNVSPKETQETQKEEEEIEEDPIIKSIVIEGYELNFSLNKYEYNLKVSEDEEHLNISVDADDNYTININNPDKLIVGENIINIKVSNKSKTQDYKIIVFKPEKTIVEEKECVNDCNIYKMIILVEGIIILLLILCLILTLVYKNKKIRMLKKGSGIVYINE